MKSALAAATSENVRVIIDEFVVICFHSEEDFLPLHHAHFAVHSLGRLLVSFNVGISILILDRTKWAHRNII